MILHKGNQHRQAQAVSHNGHLLGRMAGGDFIHCGFHAQPYLPQRLPARRTGMQGLEQAQANLFRVAGANIAEKLAFPIAQGHLPQARLQDQRRPGNPGQHLGGLAGAQQVAAVDGRGTFGWWRLRAYLQTSSCLHMPSSAADMLGSVTVAKDAPLGPRRGIPLNGKYYLKHNGAVP